MTRPALHPLRWLPPFVVGLSAAMAAEISVGLLLYAGPGLSRSLTTVLSVEAAALGVGLWSTPGPGPELVNRLRRRWLFCLLAFLIATLFVASWSVIEQVGSARLGQGIGLAFMAGLPLYACGAVLGAMGTASATEPSGRLSSVGAPAAFGAALGFAATGISLPQALTPASPLLLCLVLLSAGGLIYGSVLDARLRIQVRARRPSPIGDVRVEDRHLPLRDGGARLLYEGRCLRRWMALHDGTTRPWDVEVYDAVRGSEDRPAKLLLVGGGASSLPRHAVRSHASVQVDVLERSQGVLELGSEFLETDLRAGVRDRVHVRLGNVEDAVEDSEKSYDLVMVDTAALCPLGGVASLTRRGREALDAVLAPGGVLAFGPLRPNEDAGSVPGGWSSATFHRALPAAVNGLGDRRAGVTEGKERVELRWRTGDAFEPPDMQRFEREQPREPEGVAVSVDSEPDPVDPAHGAPSA